MPRAMATICHVTKGVNLHFDVTNTVLLFTYCKSILIRTKSVGKRILKRSYIDQLIHSPP